EIQGAKDHALCIPSRQANLSCLTTSVEIESKRLPRSPHVVGVDMGLLSFLTTSDGEKVENPRFVRRDEADLKRGQKLKDAAKSAQKWDENRHRKKALSHIHERIRFRQHDRLRRAKERCNGQRSTNRLTQGQHTIERRADYRQHGRGSGTLEQRDLSGSLR